MRNRREEYTKRFEELTKQEIKNYNDSLLNTHMALEEFRRNLKDSVDAYARHVAILSDHIKKVETDNKNLKTTVKSVEKKLKDHIDEFNRLEKNYLIDAKAQKDQNYWVIKEFGLQYDAIKSLQTIIKDSTTINKRRTEDVFQEVSHCYSRTKKDNDKLMEEILSIPSESTALEERLTPKFSELAIEKESLLKEVRIIKKKHTIQESLNEYFHIQLDRIKARMEKCPKPD